MEPTAVTCIAEKEGKYCASWRPRYLRFSLLTRELSYTADASSCDIWKQSMTVRKISRLAETKRFVPGTFERRDILVFSVDGYVLEDKVNTTRTVLDDVEQADLLVVPSRAQQVQTWTFRFNDDELFTSWWWMIREALVAAGLMRPMDGGLPPVDFRFHLPYARVPLELLADFRLLDTAVFFFVESGNLACCKKQKGADVSGTILHIVSDGALVVGDTSLYVLRQDGMIVRWVELVHAERVHCGEDYVVIETGGPNADVAFHFHGFFGGLSPAMTVKRFAEIVSALSLAQHAAGKAVEICPTSANLLDFLSRNTFRYFPGKDFSDHVTCPQSKAKLFALREQQLHSRDLPQEFSPSPSVDFSPRKLQATRSKRGLLNSPQVAAGQQTAMMIPASPQPPSLATAADPSLALDEEVDIADSVDLEGDVSAARSDDDDDDLELQLSLLHAVHGTSDSQQIDLDDI